MRKVLAAAALALLGAVALAQSDITAFVGKWGGTWEGGGSGRFDLTIERGSDGQPAGGVSVGTDQGGTFDGGAAEGTWSLVAKGGDQSFAGGSWKVSKK